MVAAGPSDLSRGRQHRTSASRAARTKIRAGRPHSHPHNSTHSTAHKKPPFPSGPTLGETCGVDAHSPADREFLPPVFQDSHRLEDRALFRFFSPRTGLGACGTAWVASRNTY